MCFLPVFLITHTIIQITNRLSGIENGLLGLTSRVNAILWSTKCANDIENIDIICFGCLLYEMCTGIELQGQPSQAHLYVDLERYPQVGVNVFFV